MYIISCTPHNRCIWYNRRWLTWAFKYCKHSNNEFILNKRFSLIIHVCLHCVITEDQFATICYAEEQCNLQAYKWEAGDDRVDKVVWIKKGWFETDSDEAVWCCANFINPMEQNLFTSVKLLWMHRLGESLENKGWHKQVEAPVWSFPKTFRIIPSCGCYRRTNADD